MSRLEKHCELYHKWRKEAEQVCEHMTETEKHAWAMFNVKHHPSAKRSFKVSWKLVAQIVVGLLLLLLGHYLHAQTITPTVTKSQIIAPLDVSGNVKVNCFVGCSATVPASFGAAFPATGTAIGVQSGGNMVSLLADGSSNLFVNCAVGCAGGTSTPADAFGNPTTAGLAMNFPMLWNGATWDRLYGDKTNGAFVNIKNSVAISSTQGTSPWVVSASGNFGVTQQTSPWVSSITTWATGTLGAMANYGTSPGTVLVPGMNAFITNVPHTICDSGCAGGSLSNNNAAPANNNTGVLPAIANAAQPSWTEGDQVLQSADLHGNQRTFPGASLGSLTPITSVNGTLNAVFPIVTGTGVPAVLVQLDQTTTITAGAIRFQVSFDGTNYVNISSDAVIDPTSATQATISMPYTLQASTNKSFLILMKGAQALQILQSTALTGTGSVTPFYSLLPTNAGNSNPQPTNVTQFGGSSVVTSGQNGTAAVGGDAADASLVSSDTNPVPVSGSDYNQFGSNAGGIPKKHIGRVDNNGNSYVVSTLDGPTAAVLQKTNAVSAGTVTSISANFPNPPTSGGSVVVIWAIGTSNNNTMTIADNNCTSYIQAYNAFGFSPRMGISYCPYEVNDWATSSSTITMSWAGIATSMAFEAWEISGPILYDSGADGANGVNGSLHSTLTTDLVILSKSNDLVFGAVGLASANTITFTTSGYANDSGTLNPSSPSGLAAFAAASASFSNSTASTSSLNATFNNSTSSIILASFKALGSSRVKVSDGNGNPLTSNSTTPAAHFALDFNLTSLLGTAPTSAGKLDVKAAANDLNVLLPAETTKVIGTVRTLGNAGGAFDAAKAANAPANGLMIAGSDYGGTPALQFWKVDSSGNGQVAITNTPAVTLSGSSNAVNATLSAETTKVIGTVNQGTSPWVENATLQASSAVIGHVIADANASVVIGKVAIDQTTPGTTNAVEITASTDANIGLTSTSKAAVTSSVSVKTTAGNVYGVFFLNGAVAGCWLELINSASAGTLGSAVITNIPMASAGTQLLTFNPPIGGFTSGIAVGSASAIGGASACGTAATGVTILYK